MWGNKETSPSFLKKDKVNIVDTVLDKEQNRYLRATTSNLNSYVSSLRTKINKKTVLSDFKIVKTLG